MPYTVTWESNGFYKKFTGVVTGAELLASVIDVASDRRFKNSRYEVSDYLSADYTEFSQDTLNEVRAVRIGSFQTNPRIQVAIVTLDPQIQQRIFSTIATRMTLHPTQLFSTVDEANVWLGRVAD
jgi:predicted RNA-binding protein with PIN domain